MLGPAELFGDIDIYLLDQILRGRIGPGMSIFDAGCGGGRNLVYFLRAGYEVRAVDADPDAIACVRRMAAALAPSLRAENFWVERLEKLKAGDVSADVVISNAVLHFAENDQHFREMLQGTWRVVRRGGLFFCRLASLIGQEGRAMPLGQGRYLLADGSERYLVDEPMLLKLTKEFGAELLDPIKTTVVQDQRSMTTWVLRKR